MFQQFRLQALQNPNIIPQLLQFVQQNHPNIFQLLSTNPNLMYHLLIHGRPNVIGAPGQNNGDNLPGSGGQPAPAPAPPQPPVQQPTIELSEDDRNNIQTIMEMGFTQEQAIEAYLVCNKNVELAINYLFDQN
jgi:UV excision repair protein RAD23